MPAKQKTNGSNLPSPQSVAGQALALANRFEKAAGKGLENTDVKDYAIPFMQILQTNSPQVNPSEGAYIPVAKPGMIINTVTNKCYTNIRTIPCLYTFKIVEWKPRTAGGGFVKQWDREDAPTDYEINDKGRAQRKCGTELIDTGYYYCLIDDPDEPEPYQAVIGMASTQLRKSRAWNSRMKALRLPSSNGQGTFNPPTFSHEYKLSTVPQKNDKGSWYGWEIGAGVPVREDAIFDMAEQFAEAARGMNVKPVRDEEDESAI